LGRAPERGCSFPGVKLPGELGTSTEGWGEQRQCPCLEELCVSGGAVSPG